MKNKLLYNIVFYGLGDFLVTAISAFLLLPIYIKYLSPGEYGIFNIVNNNTIIFTYIFQFGIISAFSRLFFQYKSNKEKYINSIIFFHIGSSIILFAFSYFFSDIIFGVLSPSIQKSNYKYIAVLIGFSTFIPNLYYALLRIEQKAKTFFLLQVFTSVLLLGMISFFIFFSSLTLQSLFFSILVTNALMLLMTFCFFWRSLSFQLEFVYIIETIKLGFPIFIGYIAYFFISRYSVVILQTHIDLKKMGVFTFAQQIAVVPTLISAIVGKAVQPYLFASENDEILAVRASNVNRVYKLFLFWVVTGLIFFIEDVFKAILPPNYIPSIPIIQQLLAITLIFNLYLVESSILLYKLKSGIILFITLIGSIINILLCQLLVKNFEINGVLTAMLIAFSATYILQIFFSRRYLKIKYQITEILIFVITLIAFFFLFVEFKVSEFTQYKTLFKIICFIILTIMSIFSLRKIKRYFNAQST